MKPGDKVWWFDELSQEIKERVALDVEERDGKIWVVCAPSANCSRGVVHFLGFDCFPTRDALCEHYRKIFE